jgi:hypothetical protein
LRADLHPGREAAFLLRGLTRGRHRSGCARRSPGHAWITKHPGAMLLSLEDAFELGRRTNQMRYGEALLNAS